MNCVHKYLYTWYIWWWICLQNDPLLKDLHPYVTLEEVNSMIALEYGQAMVVNVRRGDGDVMRKSFWKILIFFFKVWIVLYLCFTLVHANLEYVIRNWSGYTRGCSSESAIHQSSKRLNRTLFDYTLHDKMRIFSGSPQLVESWLHPGSVLYFVFQFWRDSGLNV